MTRKRLLRRIAATSFAALAASGVSTALGTTPPAFARDAAQWPFASSSPWNMPIGSGATYGAPASNACSAGTSDPSLATDVNAGEWSHPVYVASSTDPTWKIKVGGQVVASVHAPKNIQPALPTFAQDPGTDAHLHIIDPAHSYVDELWHARVYPTKLLVTADSHTRNYLSGSGVGSGGERAYGGSAIGGLIRTWELQSGAIRHVLALALPVDHQRLGWVWPASSQDSFAVGSYTGSVPMGTLVAIPPSVNVNALGLSPAGLAVAHALQDFGAYDVDSSSELDLYAEPPAEPLVQPIRNDLPTLAPLLRCVTNNTPTTPGGGGTPRVALAPSL
jgi:hypothetical protein